MPSKNTTINTKLKKRQDKFAKVRAKFKEGDWVYGIGKHEGCSPVFNHDKSDIQPFSYLNEANPDEFRLATEEEIANAKIVTGE